MADAMSMGDST
jgi:signal transduction histidine kinase